MKKIKRFGHHLSIMTFLVMALIAISCGDDPYTSSGTPEIITTPPNVLEFPRVIMGESVETELKILNVGDGDLSIINLVLRSDSSEFSISNVPDFPLTVKPNDNFSIRIKYSPVDEVLDHGTIEISSNDPDDSLYLLNLSTLNIEPDIYVDPSEINFGRVLQGERDVRQVHIRNIGQSPLKISDIDITGSPDFDIEILDNPYTAEDGSIELPVYKDGIELNIYVVYHPEAPGADTAELVVQSNDKDEGVYRISIEANGTSPCLLVSTDQIDFGEVHIGTAAEETVTITNCGTADLVIEEIEQIQGAQFELLNVPTSEEVIEPEQIVTFSIIYAPTDEDAHGGKFVIVNNDEAQPDYEISVFGRGILNECPIAVGKGQIFGEIYTGLNIEAIPLQELILDGTDSYDPDGELVELLWEIVDRPDGSTAQLRPVEGESSNPAKRQFFLDLAGQYRFKLTVIDDQGLTSDSEECEGSAVVTVVAIPDEAIHVQLVWYNPDDPVMDGYGSDVDLHMTWLPGGSWFGGGSSGNSDCYFANRSPSWPHGELPSLDIDDVNEAGPENINLDNPGNCIWYVVGIHYWSEASMGTAYVTARIYINGSLVFEVLNKPMLDREMWDVARIHWPSGRVIEVDEMYAADFDYRGMEIPTTPEMIESGLCGTNTGE